MTLSLSLTVVAETDHYVVVDKPALLDCQNSRDDRPSVVGWLLQRYGYSGLVHRLDFGTSGLLLCAKNANAAARLSKIFQEGAIQKTYWALAIGKIANDAGEISSDVDGKSAKTFYKVLKRFANATLLEVQIETGRKHQIRHHFSELGHPLIGDHLYKKGGSHLLLGRPALHAKRLEFDGQVYESALPLDIEELMARLPAG